MKTLKNILILAFTIFSFAASTHAQTQVGLFTGIDALRLNSHINEDCLYYQEGCIKNGFAVNTPLIGIRINQMISPKIALTYQSAYTKTKFEFLAYLQGFVYIYTGNNIEFNHFMHQLGANYYINERFYIGASLGLQQYRDIVIYYEKQYSDRTENSNFKIDHKHQFGAALSAGYSIRNIDIQLNLYQGITSAKISDWEYFDTNTSQKISLTVGYLFNLNLRGKNRKTDCPKF